MAEKRIAVLIGGKARYFTKLELTESASDGYSHRILVVQPGKNSHKFHMKILIGGPTYANCFFTDDPADPRIKSAGTIEVDLANLQPSYEASTTIRPTAGSQDSSKNYWRFSNSNPEQFLNPQGCGFANLLPVLRANVERLPELSNEGIVLVIDEEVACHQLQPRLASFPVNFDTKKKEHILNVHFESWEVLFPQTLSGCSTYVGIQRLRRDCEVENGRIVWTCWSNGKKINPPVPFETLVL